MSLKEKDIAIQELIQKNQDLEALLTQINPDFVLLRSQSTGCETQGSKYFNFMQFILVVLKNFCTTSMEDLIFDRKPYPNMKMENEVADTLHKEIIAFEKSIDQYNRENEQIFIELLDLIKESLSEIVNDAEVLALSSFLINLVHYLWLIRNRTLPPMV